MILVPRNEPALDKVFDVPSVFDKVEAFDLKNALRPTFPYIDLTIHEYDSIANRLILSSVTVYTNELYNNRAMYSVMPRQIFDKLEQAFVNDEQTTTLDKQLFDKMFHDYTLKMKAI